ncbi:MAG: hypothetical protein EOR68_06625 [Mesorhizobium sp.]|uniref:DUF5801 repeats-in-toxin domain-containing protein n=2 Tax=Mesorhizobium sp. TaxID=1871066 RepID=UPI000FEA3028|nr:DUF5801 repeats-in-toxin domain-containing protein [Mesorhizobium sp.]RWM02697.1 MAG: hypothetical protein EOR68_06625 [Mesorhizobium sp.]
MTTIDINGTLTLDQTSGLQDDDIAISNDLTGLSTPFRSFLNGLTGDLQLSAAQLSFADDVEAAASGASFVTVNPDGATISNLFFSDGSGNAFDGDQVIYNGNALQTINGENIYLHSYANGTIVLATTSATEGVGDVVAAFYLNTAADSLSASIEMVTFEAIAHPDSTNSDDSIDWTNLLNVSTTGSVSFNFDGLASGNNLFVAVGTSGAGMVVSGIHPVIKADGTLDNSGDNIKTSQGGIGATIGVNNQMFDPGETAVFSFVKGQAPGTYNDLDNMNYNDFIDVKDATLFISQTEGSPGTNFTVKIGAFSAGGASTNPESGRSYLDNNLASGANLGNDAGQSALTDDTAVAIVRVVIKDGNGQLVTDTTVTNGFVTFNADGTITAQHLNDAYTVQWFTDNSGTQAIETFNRFQATAVVGKFDVGRVDLSQGVTVTQSVGDKLHTDDDGPHISTTGTEPTLTVDETVLATNDTKSFAANFSSGYGTDGAGTLTYALSIAAGSTGLVDTATGQAVVLSVNGSGVVEGRTATSNDLVFTVSVSSTGSVTLDQIRAVVHSDTTNDDDSKTLAADNLIQLTATITDKDGDHQSATLNIGQNLNFKDDGPSISTTGTEPTLTVDETVLATNDTKSFAANFSSAFGADGAGTLTYALSVTAGSTGLVDTATGQAVVLSVNGSGVVEGRTVTSNDLVFTVSVSGTGSVTLDQIRAVVHPTTDPDESKTLAADNLIQLTATVTDKDGDHHSATLDIGQNLNFKDDGPTITKPFDGDQSAGNGTGTHETLSNIVGQQATGDFGYSIGSDQFAAYDATHSDFVDQDSVAAGNQLSLTGYLTGLVPNTQTQLISSYATLQSESATSATFDWQISYDSDPNTAGDQTATAGGTLVFNKTAGTYTITLNDAADGFSFDVLHTAELVAKQPTSNTGHPPIVLETLVADDPNTQAHDGFYVQFTGNLIDKTHPFSVTSDGEGSSTDTTFNSTPPTPAGTHDMISNSNETWVSATQSTNGVAGDTIQKGELLTLRFFDSNVGIQTEATDPSASASAVALKFDGIGSSEDLMMILDLTDGTNEITRAIYVSNSDIYRMGQVPSPYNGEFTLDNNDGLVIIEQNDYNAAGEHYVIQGIQIMQSGNGITGQAIDLNGTTGTLNGGSSATSNLVAFDPVDNDVLKITDIGFVSTQTTTPDAHLDFGVQIADADGDTTTVQHILVDIA